MGRAAAIAKKKPAKPKPKKGRPAGPGDSHVTEVRLDAIRLDGGTQPRRATDPAVVEEYAAAMRAGAVFPPPVVFGNSSARSYFLADGFHRVLALRSLERDVILADLREGTRRDAILYSVGANASHGMRRTREDARRSVLTLLRDEEWGKRSDRWIAEKAHVNDKTVAKYRAELEPATCGIPHLREGRDGKSYAAPTPPPRSPTPTQTTVVYDGEAGPDDEVWDDERYPDADGPPLPPHTVEEDEGGSFEDAADRTLERVARHAEAGNLVPSKSGRLPPGDGAGFDEAGPVSLVARDETWRDVLGLPAGTVTAAQVLGAADRARSACASARGGVVALEDERRITAALARGLSQWDTQEREARMVADVALAGLRVPTADRPLRILEPNAGRGALVRGLVQAGITEYHPVLAIEVDPDRAEGLRSELTGELDEVLCGDFLELAPPTDLVVMNPPYESGLDGRHVAHAMELATQRVVALLRLNALTGQGRYDLVWRAVAEAEASLEPAPAWVLSEVVILVGRPSFDGPGEFGARSDHVIIRLDRVEPPRWDPPRTIVRWA